MKERDSLLLTLRTGGAGVHEIAAVEEEGDGTGRIGKPVDIDGLLGVGDRAGALDRDGVFGHRDHPF